jgi:hypothetical protein
MRQTIDHPPDTIVHIVYMYTNRHLTGRPGNIGIDHPNLGTVNHLSIMPSTRQVPLMEAACAYLLIAGLTSQVRPQNKDCNTNATHFLVRRCKRVICLSSVGRRRGDHAA